MKRSFLRDLRLSLKAVDEADLCFDPILFRALIAAEDRRFLFHCGIDPISIGRAAMRWLFWRRLEGASTLEAQFVRTVSGRREISLRRKLREAAIASAISLLKSKRRIAMAYLEIAYFGFEERGIKFAASALAIDLGKLNVSDACDLVARLKRPSSEAAEVLRNSLLRRRIAWLLPKVCINAAPLVKIRVSPPSVLSHGARYNVRDAAREYPEAGQPR